MTRPALTRLAFEDATQPPISVPGWLNTLSGLGQGESGGNLHPLSVIANLQSRGIVLSLENGQIRYRAPRDSLTDADKELLRGRRDQIVDFLSAREAGRGLRAITGRPGPLTASVAQEMWWRFGGGPNEGKPVTLNIWTVGQFRGVGVSEVIKAIKALLPASRYLQHPERVFMEKRWSCLLTIPAALRLSRRTLPIWGKMPPLPLSPSGCRNIASCSTPSRAQGTELAAPSVLFSSRRHRGGGDFFQPYRHRRRLA